MRKIRTTSGYILLFILYNLGSAVAQDTMNGIQNKSQPSLELREGDRVVFLGNSLFENDLPYGYLEFALATRAKDRNVTFRNLGWSGDTVFGEARSYFTSPPTAYELLLQQLTDADPTVVFVAYGSIEAAHGPEGLPRFKQGLEQLLDKIEELGATAVLLSTLPQFPSEFEVDLEKHNDKLKRYSSAIERTAEKRNLVFLDIFNPMHQLSTSYRVSENGIHLNELGYYLLAGVIEQRLGYAPRVWEIDIDISGPQINASFSVDLTHVENGAASISFVTKETLLPLPLPGQIDKPVPNLPTLRVKGLKKGNYQLQSDNFPIIALSSAKNWKSGEVLSYAPTFFQANELRDLIIKKNELFFHRYRPLNRTYILGFRSYEQGRHIKGLEDLDAIVQWLEGQIEAVRMPRIITYSLSPIQ